MSTPSKFRGWWLPGLLMVCVTPGSAAAETYRIDGGQMEATLAPEPSEMMLGEPACFALILRNDSDEDWWVLEGGDDINRLHRPSSFSVVVTAADGKTVAQPDSDEGVAGNSWAGPQKIPAHGSYAFRLRVPDWATLTTPGTYSVEVRKELLLGRWKNLDHWQDQNRKLPARLTASFEVIPRDEEKMRQVIARLGETMLHGKGRQAYDAADTLARVDDLRTVPYFVQAATLPDYSLVFVALDALGRYNDETAFEALRRGLTISASDFGAAAAEHGLNDSSFDNLRFCAACALCKSPHPGAFPYSVSKRAELDAKARNNIAIGLARKMAPEEAIPILHELAHDPVDWVRLDAEQSLSVRSGQSTGPVTPGN